MDGAAERAIVRLVRARYIVQKATTDRRGENGMMEFSRKIVGEQEKKKKKKIFDDTRGKEPMT